MSTNTLPNIFKPCWLALLTLGKQANNFHGALLAGRIQTFIEDEIGIENYAQICLGFGLYIAVPLEIDVSVMCDAIIRAGLKFSAANYYVYPNKYLIPVGSVVSVLSKFSTHTWDKYCIKCDDFTNQTVSDIHQNGFIPVRSDIQRQKDLSKEKAIVTTSRKILDQNATILEKQAKLSSSIDQALLSQEKAAQSNKILLDCCKELFVENTKMINNNSELIGNLIGAQTKKSDIC